MIDYLGWRIILCHVILLAMIQECVGTSNKDSTMYDCTGTVTGECRPPSTCPKEFHHLCKGKEGFCCPDYIDLSSTFLRAMRSSRRHCSQRKCQRYYRGWWADDCGEHNHLFFCKRTAKWCCNQSCRMSKHCKRWGGYCTIHESTCDGVVRRRGCSGPKCVCCMPRSMTSCPFFTLVNQGETGTFAVGTTSKIYDNWLSCEWLIETPPNTTILVSFSRFEVELESHCNYDSLEIIDLPSFEPLTGKLCGSNLPPSVPSSSNNVLIRFQTDASDREHGFRLTYTALQTSTSPTGVSLLCDGVEGLSASSDQSTLTVWYDAPNTNSHSCTWRIQAPLHNAVRVSLDQLEVGNCSGLGSITIHDFGFTSTEYCQSGAPEIYISQKDYIWVTFSTADNWNAQGFSLQYNSIPFPVSESPSSCSPTTVLTDTSGFISVGSPSVKYESELNCTWEVQTPVGTSISITFLRFYLDCEDDDFVKITDLSNNSSLLMDETCGDTIPSPISSSSNHVLIQFFSNEYTLAHLGFTLNYST